MHNPPLIRCSALVSLLSVAIVVGCGGGVQSSIAGGGGLDGSVPGADAGRTTDGAVRNDAAPSPCPASTPASGAPCSPEALSCEYGADQDIACDTIAACVSGRWSITAASMGDGCPTSTPGTNGCPNTYADVPVGRGCTGSMDCGYPEGRCACTVPLGGPVEINDAGETWVCEQVATGCPEPRPTAGSSCAFGPATCDYGGCSLPGGTDMACVDGTWQAVPTACPLLVRSSGAH